MGKRGRRRALCENKKKDDEESYYYDSSEEQYTKSNVTTHDGNIYNTTEEKLFELCKDYTHKCDHLKYIGPSDIRRFDNECYEYIGLHAYCAPIVVEFLECALKILIDECKKLKIFCKLEDQYDICLESFKYQLCIKLSKYYTAEGART